MGLRRSPHLCAQHTSISLPAAQKKIFAANMTPRRLSKLMNTDIHPGNTPAEVLAEVAKKPLFKNTHSITRYKFVNWDRIGDNLIPAGARTIEFRQHRASLDHVEIAHWVHFVLSLVKLAERKAVTPFDLSSMTDALPKPTYQAKQGTKYVPRAGSLEAQLSVFFQELDFDARTRAYWMGKFKEFNPVMNVSVDEVGNVSIVTSEAECPACAFEKGRREREAAFNAVGRTRAASAPGTIERVVEAHGGLGW